VISRTGIVLLVVAAMALPWGTVDAQTDEDAEKEKPWRNSTDLSFVVTEGNSDTSTFGLNNNFRWSWEDKARFRWKIEATRTDKADDRSLQVDPSFTWEPGEEGPGEDVTTTLVEPPSEPDVQIFFTEARYDRHIRERVAWNAGASWDRNVDAGILSRTILFGGMTNVFWDKKDELEFNLSYGLSFTDREEENPDPEKEDQFAGVRFTWDYLNKWGSVTTYENDLTTNVSLADLSDYFVNMTQAISVSMSKKLAIRVSLQWLYNAEPALEDVDVLARVEIVDPDGIPGSGDEFFLTVDSGGVEVELGEDQVRKKSLDTIFRTSLVIKF
jgi:putative salt-induced outer membrane protein YdiY